MNNNNSMKDLNDLFKSEIKEPFFYNLNILSFSHDLEFQSYKQTQIHTHMYNHTQLQHTHRVE